MAGGARRACRSSGARTVVKRRPLVLVTRSTSVLKRLILPLLPTLLCLHASAADAPATLAEVHGGGGGVGAQVGEMVMSAKALLSNKMLEMKTKREELFWWETYAHEKAGLLAEAGSGAREREGWVNPIAGLAKVNRAIGGIVESSQRCLTQPHAPDSEQPGVGVREGGREGEEQPGWQWLVSLPRDKESLLRSAQATVFALCCPSTTPPPLVFALCCPSTTPPPLAECICVLPPLPSCFCMHLPPLPSSPLSLSLPLSLSVALAPLRLCAWRRQHL